MDLRISLSNSKFVMIHVNCKMLVLLKNHLNYLFENIFECVFKKYNRLLFFSKIDFFKIYTNVKFKS